MRRNALITGGSRGIGAAISRQLAQAGYYVYVNHRSSTKDAGELLDIIRARGGKGELIAFDVTDQRSIAEALHETNVPRLDVLVNNAGILRDNLVLSTTDKDWRDVIRTNFLGMVNTFKSSRARLEKSDMPTVVNVASISGFRGGKGQCSYATSKAMVIEWTRVLASEFGARGMRCFAVSPGPVATEMIVRSAFYQNPEAQKAVPVGRFATPDEIGDLVCSLVELRGAVENGANWIVDGGFTLSQKA